MATIDRGTILVARQSFTVWDGGRMLRFRRGRTTIREGHRLLEGREDRFKPLELTFELDDRPAPAASSGSSRPSALEEFAALRAKAKSLGIPATGKRPELEAAIAAEERRRRGG
jgi:hypothetical protein